MRRLPPVIPARYGKHSLSLPLDRIAAIFLAVLLMAATATLAYLSYSWSRDRGIARLQQTAENRINLFSMRLSAPTDKYSYLPKLVSSHPIVAEAFLHPADQRRIGAANRLLARLNDEAGSAVIYMMDMNGMTIAASNWEGLDSFVGVNYGYRPYFTDALHAGRGRFYAMGLTTGLPGYYISHLLRKDGIPLGVVVAKVDMHRLNHGWGTVQSEMMVTDENGVTFLSSRQDWMYRPMRPLSPERKEQLRRTRQYEAVLKEPLEIARRKILNSSEGIFSIASFGEDGNKTGETSYFVQKRRLPDSEWEIIVLSPMAQIDMEAQGLALITVIGAALLCLSALYASQARSRRKERRQAQQALREAHRVLEQQHRELQAMSRELEIKATTDGLTGCYNRRYFVEAAVRLVQAARRHRMPLSIIMMDIDHFKRINDQHGHQAGDRVLETVAAVCREALREEDVFARHGGEEFIVALPHTDAPAAALVAERLRQRVMAQEFPVPGKILHVTLSAGVSEYRPEEIDIEDTIRRADQSLYEAKEGGRNRVHTIYAL